MNAVTLKIRSKKDMVLNEQLVDEDQSEIRHDDGQLLEVWLTQDVNYSIVLKVQYQNNMVYVPITAGLYLLFADRMKQEIDKWEGTPPAAAQAWVAQQACEHNWGIDGMHNNEYCKKCFVGKPAAAQE
jgi:hypothetical protein